MKNLQKPGLSPASIPTKSDDPAALSPDIVVEGCLKPSSLLVNFSCVMASINPQELGSHRSGPPEKLVGSDFSPGAGPLDLNL